MSKYLQAKEMGLECIHCHVTFGEYDAHPENGCHMAGKTLYHRDNDRSANYRTAVRYEEREML